MSLIARLRDAIARVEAELAKLNADLRVARQNYEIIHNSWVGMQDTDDARRQQIAERDSEIAELRKRPTLEQALKGILGHMGRYDWGHRDALGCATEAIRALYGEEEAGR